MGSSQETCQRNGLCLKWSFHGERGDGEGALTKRRRAGGDNKDVLIFIRNNLNGHD